jgi:hypothetical protein
MKSASICAVLFQNEKIMLGMEVVKDIPQIADTDITNDVLFISYHYKKYLFVRRIEKKNNFATQKIGGGEIHQVISQERDGYKEDGKHCQKRLS